MPLSMRKFVDECVSEVGVIKNGLVWQSPVKCSHELHQSHERSLKIRVRFVELV